MALSSTDAFMASLEGDEELLISNLSPLLLDCSPYLQKSVVAVDAEGPSSSAAASANPGPEPLTSLMEFLNSRSLSSQEIDGDDEDDRPSFLIGRGSPAAAYHELRCAGLDELLEAMPQQEHLYSGGEGRGSMHRELGYGGREGELTPSASAACSSPRAAAAGVDPPTGMKGSSQLCCARDLHRQPRAAQANRDTKKTQELLRPASRHSGKSFKNLDCERRRRQKLKESLYALRALVPSITKMDKASIISDSIDYVQRLQKQVMDIEIEIYALKSWGLSLKRNYINGSCCPISSIQHNNKEQKIIELDVTKLEKSIYELKVLCLKGPGVLMNLCKAIDTLQLHIINANLMAFDDLIVSTLFVEATYGAELKPSELKGMILKVLLIFGLKIAGD